MAVCKQLFQANIIFTQILGELLLKKGAPSLSLNSLLGSSVKMDTDQYWGKLGSDSGFRPRGISIEKPITDEQAEFIMRIKEKLLNAP